MRLSLGSLVGDSYMRINKNLTDQDGSRDMIEGMWEILGNEGTAFNLLFGCSGFD